MKKFVMIALILILNTNICLASTTFRHNKRKIKVEAIKRGDFKNNIIRIAVNVKGGKSCKEGIIKISLSGLGLYSIKQIKVTDYPSYHFFQSRVTAPKSQPYNKVKIHSATFDCYR